MYGTVRGAFAPMFVLRGTKQPKHCFIALSVYFISKRPHSIFLRSVD